MIINHHVRIANPIKTLGSKLKTAALCKSLRGATHAYDSAVVQRYSQAYSPQMSLLPAALAQNAGCSGCWGNTTWKSVAAATLGDFKHGCIFTPWRNSKRRSLGEGKQSLDLSLKLKFGNCCFKIKWCLRIENQHIRDGARLESFS